MEIVEQRRPFRPFTPPALPVELARDRLQFARRPLRSGQAVEKRRQGPTLVQRRGRVGLRPPQRFQGLVEPLHPLGQPIQARPEGLFVHRAGLFEQGLAPLPQRLPASADVCRPILERPLHRQVEVRLEEPLQDRLPLLRTRREQFPELPLGQHDDLAELLAAEADQLLDCPGDPGPAVGQHRALFARIRARPFPQRRVRLLDRRPVTPSLGALLLRHPAHPEQPLAQGEIEHHLREQVGSRVVAAHLSAVALRPRGVAVEGEADPVKQGRLARAGGARDQEQTVARQLVEGKALGRGEGAEGAQLDGNRPHSPASRSRARRASRVSANSLACWSLSGSPVTCSKKLPNNTFSLRRN